MTMEDLINKFLYLLRFMPYIKEEKVKVQWFLSYLLQYYKCQIEFDNLKTLDEALRKARLCFEQYKQRNDLSKSLKDKNQEMFNQWEMGFQPPPFKNMPRNPPGNSYNRNEQFQQKGNKPVNLGSKGDVGKPKEPLKCLECGDPHLWRNFPLFNKTNRVVHNFQEASTIGEVGKFFDHINAALENR